MKYNSSKEWFEEGKRRFGEDYRKWKFKCPMCGHVASIGDFEKYKDKGATPDSAYVDCIGRYEGAGIPTEKNKLKGCNWAAYGLFGTCGKGDSLIVNSGKEIELFAFADSSLN